MIDSVGRQAGFAVAGSISGRVQQHDGRGASNGLRSVGEAVEAKVGGRWGGPAWLLPWGPRLGEGRAAASGLSCVKGLSRQRGCQSARGSLVMLWTSTFFVPYDSFTVLVARPTLPFWALHPVRSAHHAYN